MSALGDRIIADGPTAPGALGWNKTAHPAEWNALRDELIELRARVAPPLGACVIEGHGGHPAWECKRRDAVPVDALRWQPGEWRGVAPDNQPGTQTVSGTVERADGLHQVTATVYGLPPEARVDLVDGEVRVYQDSGPAVSGDFLARVVPGDVRPGDVAMVAGGEVRVFRDALPPSRWLCPVCYRPMSPGIVECAGCAGAEDAAAKRRTDQ